MGKTYKDLKAHLQEFKEFSINTMTAKINSIKTLNNNKVYYNIYSYNTIIAVVVIDDKNYTCYLSTAKYSRTTSRQQGYIKQAYDEKHIKEVDVDFFVNNLHYTKSDFLRSQYS